MACLLRYGVPAAGNAEKVLAQYQAVFDTH